ncbi:hypothetical protein ADK34_27140 [Streptomyces viridochromogenes]|uniref:Uncharacterized protein n=1 Tax=Streptomyces viridochromogenes TaxID=1938 RepID=A0A0L8JPW9_STRVR|nr:hypothetical protein ADK34_27140 [Streptomyces viridochromogenes]
MSGSEAYDDRFLHRITGGSRARCQRRCRAHAGALRVAGCILIRLSRTLPRSPTKSWLGHAARRFGHLSDEAVALARSLAARAEADPTDVDGRAGDGYDDVRSFLRLW